ncbi:MAG: hypothetical protein U0491_03415 [Candidatus Saccharimonadales bacterium]
MPKKLLGSVLILVVVFTAAGLVWTNRYNIYDWSRLRNYTAPADVAALASNSGMDSYGRRLFYVNEPKISDRTTFNSECKSTEQTIVLGCYTGTNIYVFKVDDPKLSGVQEVTAAHEMLHAAYQRLSAKDKEHVNTLLQAAYKRINDPRLTDVMASYQKTEPGEQDNELHSILGTEYANLGPELEQYYQKYFTDRAKVVALANSYKKVFDDITNQVQKYDADLVLRKAEITKREAELDALEKSLATQKSQMDSLLNSGQTRAYNNQVPSYNSAVNSYNNEVALVKRLIDQYNKIVETRNSLALQQQGLAQSLDSRVNAIAH